MISSAQPALDSQGQPLPELVSKFAAIAGTPDIGGRLVSAAAALAQEFSGKPASVLGVERMIFAALDDPMPAIERHPKAHLLRRLLQDDPAMGDGDVEDVLNFLMSHVAVKMQGEVAEILALHQVLGVLEEARRSGQLPEGARLIPGNRIRMRVENRSGWYKGADGLIAVERGNGLAVLGIIEIKSYRPSRRDLARQMLSHRSRLARGVRIDSTEWPADSLTLADDSRMRTILVTPPRGNRPHPPTSPDHLILDVPYDHLTATGQALVAWLLEQMGVKLFANADDPEDEAKNALCRALYYAECRPMSRAAVALAQKLYDIHFGGA